VTSPLCRLFQYYDPQTHGSRVGLYIRSEGMSLVSRTLSVKPIHSQLYQLFASLSPAQERKLRSCKWTQGVCTTKEKSKEIYVILIPGAEVKDIPSPCYDTNRGNNGRAEGLEDFLSTYERVPPRNPPGYIGDQPSPRIYADAVSRGVQERIMETLQQSL